MPSVRATRRASSTASVPQHAPKRRSGSAGSRQGQTRIVTPTTSKPCSTRSAAATDESTPPLMPTTMRSPTPSLSAPFAFARPVVSLARRARGSARTAPLSSFARPPAPRAARLARPPLSPLASPPRGRLGSHGPLSLRSPPRPEGGSARTSVSRAEQVGEALELVGRRVHDLDLAAALVARDPHARHERALERPFERAELRGAAPALARPALPRARELRGAADRVLRGPHRPVVREDLVAQAELLRRARQREQRARVAHREPSGAQVGLDRLRQLEQAQAVGDGAAVLADPLRQLLLRPAELREQVLVRLGLLHRVQVVAQQVLDERELEALRVRGLPHERGDPVEPGQARRAPAALAGDELVARAQSAHDHRLDHARRPDRGDKLI